MSGALNRTTQTITLAPRYQALNLDTRYHTHTAISSTYQALNFTTQYQPPTTHYQPLNLTTQYQRLTTNYQAVHNTISSLEPHNTIYNTI
eukprot:1382033-Amorphochlora_amoeboformis.AAC.1